MQTAKVSYGNVDDIREHGMSLLELHRKELKTEAPVDPEWTSYYALEEAGALITLCVWLQEDGEPDELIGYTVTFVRPHLHSRRTKMAQVDLIYLLPSFRRSRIGGVLMSDTEAAAREKGCSVIYWHAAPGSSLDKILRRSGRYTHRENTYVRNI